jgi:hypothetical protein
MHQATATRAIAAVAGLLGLAACSHERVYTFSDTSVLTGYVVRGTSHSDAASAIARCAVGEHVTAVHLQPDGRPQPMPGHPRKTVRYRYAFDIELDTGPDSPPTDAVTSCLGRVPFIQGVFQPL